MTMSSGVVLMRHRDLLVRDLALARAYLGLLGRPGGRPVDACHLGRLDLLGPWLVVLSPHPQSRLALAGI